MGRIEERFFDVGGVRCFARQVPGEGPPTVLVHGNPTHSADWIPFLERHPGPALAFDLPGFGRSDRSGPEAFDYSMYSYASFVDRLLDRLEIGRYRLVVHDWGVVALLAALREPDRLDRLALVNCVPLLPGFRWHWVARIWRRRGIGELFNAATTKPAMRAALRQARPRMRSMPPGFTDQIWRHWDRGMRRAVLRLYRSADPEALAAAGERLGEVRCPALVVWGRRDRYLPERFARAYAERLPRAELIVLEDAGHWPWLDRPDLVPRVIDFVSRPAEVGDSPT